MLLAGSLVLTAPQGGRIAAYDVTNGAFKWQRMLTNTNDTMASWASDGKRLYVAESAGILRALDLTSNGSVLWTMSMPVTQVVALPELQQVLVTTNDNSASALPLDHRRHRSRGATHLEAARR